MRFAPTILACALASAGGADEAWEETDATFPPPTVRVREVTGSELSIREGRLYRRKHGEVREVRGLAADPPGELRALAADPAGLTFVAAEHGLFVLAPDVDVLDRVSLVEGAPRGPPTSVVVDERRRVWIASASGIGSVEPSHFWGRTLPFEAPGPYSIAEAPSGGLLVRAGARTLRYVPDRGPAPTIVSVTVDGRPVARGERVTATYGEPFELRASGTAAGGASFRYRIDGHHVWRELADGVAVRTPNPGAHRLEVVALDRDLNRSAPFAVALQVPYPWYYGKRFVVAALLAAALATFAWFLLRGRAAGRLAPGRALLSTGLFLIVALQVLAGLVPHAKGWPFVGFSMYTGRFDEGDYVYDSELTAVAADGQARRVPPRWLGAIVDDPWQVLGAVIDGGEPAARAAAARYAERVPGVRLRALQVRAERTKLTAAGPVRVAPLVLVHVPLGPSREASAFDREASDE